MNHNISLDEIASRIVSIANKLEFKLKRVRVITEEDVEAIKDLYRILFRDERLADYYARIYAQRELGRVYVETLSFFDIIVSLTHAVLKNFCYYVGEYENEHARELLREFKRRGARKIVMLREDTNEISLYVFDKNVLFYYDVLDVRYARLYTHCMNII